MFLHLRKKHKQANTHQKAWEAISKDIPTFSDYADPHSSRFTLLLILLTP